MPNYRKKPVVIKAIQWTGNNFDDLAELVGDDPSLKKITCDESDGTLKVHTMEGTLIAKPGDYIIRGVKGELYPCDPEVFALTYEVTCDYDDDDGDIIYSLS